MCSDHIKDERGGGVCSNLCTRAKPFLASMHRDFSLGLNESIIKSMSPVIRPTTLVPSIKMYFFFLD